MSEIDLRRSGTPTTRPKPSRTRVCSHVVCNIVSQRKFGIKSQQKFPSIILNNNHKKSDWVPRTAANGNGAGARANFVVIGVLSKRNRSDLPCKRAYDAVVVQTGWPFKGQESFI